MKLFKVIFDPVEDRPDPEEFMNFMLATHTRLFRDYDLNETHFDKVAACFVRALEELQADQSVIDEAVSLLVPLRDVFEYGAKVAAMEKSYDANYLKMLPTTNCHNMRNPDEPTCLPEPTWIDIPQWMKDILAQHSSQGEIRAWTRHLIDAFGVDGDKVIADVFLDMPYMNHHVYCAALLQLAFLPVEHQDDLEEYLIQIIKYPRGPEKSSLSAALFERMIVQVQTACQAMDMDEDITNEAVEQLTSYNTFFANRKIRSCGGATAPHVLARRQTTSSKKSHSSSTSSSRKHKSSGSASAAGRRRRGSGRTIQSSSTTSNFAKRDGSDEETADISEMSSSDHISLSTRSDHSSSCYTGSERSFGEDDDEDFVVTESQREAGKMNKKSSSSSKSKKSGQRRKNKKTIWKCLLGWVKVDA